MDPRFSSVLRLYDTALGGMDATVTQLHPRNDPARWSTQQVVEHLLLTYRSTSNSLQERLAKGRTTQAPATLFHRMTQILVLRVGWYPPGMKAPPPVCPGKTPVTLSGSALSVSMRQELEAMDQLLDDCTHAFGLRRIASHFALGPMTVEQWRCFHVFHSRHHLRHLVNIK